MIEDVREFLANRKSNRTERESRANLEKTIYHINALISHMENKANVCADNIQLMIDDLIGDNTMVFNSELPRDTKIIRGRVKSVDSIHSTRDLSYNKDSRTVVQGRYNKTADSFFYGTIHFEEHAKRHIIFSECRVEEDASLCLLKSITTKALTYRQLGIFARVRTDQKPQYMSSEEWKCYNDIYNLCSKLSHESCFIAFLITENFLYDAMSRTSSKKVYDVTNAIADILLDDSESNTNVEGLLFNSIFDNNSPNIVLKPETVDNKLKFHGAEAFRINRKFPYNLYSATQTHIGKIKNDDTIVWGEISS